MEIKKFLDNFEKIISKLTRVPDLKIYGICNMVIGGSCALELHGLKLQRKPNDLDLIIFKPTPKQMEIIDLVFTESIDYKTLPEDEKVNSFVYEKDGLKLNVLISGLDMPELPLILAYNDYRYMRVNSIQNIIAAKCSYAAGEDEKFSRTKDIEDLLHLKNLNFNIPTNTPITDTALVKYVK